MKIATLTLPFNNNYGGYLQAYALQEVLKQLGHEVTIIYRQDNWVREPQGLRVLLGKCKRFLLSGKWLPVGAYERRGYEMLKFVRTRMNLSAMLYTSDELHSYCRRHCFDAVVVGSDQPWRPDYVPNVEDYFLNYVSADTIKISYAASFGNSEPDYTEHQRMVCGGGIVRFKAVSVRETSGIDVIKRFGWHVPKVSVLLDPTMLLSKEHYEFLLETYTPQTTFQGKIVCYILDIDNRAREIIAEVAAATGRPVQHIVDPEKSGMWGYILPAIEEWLSAFHDADYVVTDSFHGTVFSILMHKPFVVLINTARGSSRFDTLLNHFGLTDRVVGEHDTAAAILQRPIDWERVDAIRDAKSKEAVGYLKEALKAK